MIFWNAEHIPPIGTPMPGAVVLPMGGGIDGAFGDGSFETLYNIYGYVSKNVPGIHWFPYEICHLFNSK